MCFFRPSAFFALTTEGPASCSGHCATQRARPDPIRKFGSWPRSVAHALWVQSGKSARGGICARRAIQAHANPRTLYLINRLKKCPTSHVISGILNVINVVRHYIPGDGKVFPRHQHARHMTIYIILTYSSNLRPFAKLIDYKPTHNLPYCVPHLRNKIKELNYTPNPQPNLYIYICIFVLVILLI